AVRGLYRGYDRDFLIDETIKYLFYPITYYFFLLVFDEKKELGFIKKIFEYCIILASIASLEIIMMYLFITKGERVLTRFGNVILVGLLIALSFLRFKGVATVIRIYYYFSIVIMSIGILLTMQRSIWIATAASVVVFYFLDLISKKASFKESVLKLLVLCILLSSIIYVFNRISLNTEAIMERTENMLKGEVDSSLAIRIYTFLKVLDITKDEFLLGRGLGDAAFFPLLTSHAKNLVDNSYISIYWKMGLLGLLTFFILYTMVFWKLICIIKLTNDPIVKSISIIIFSVFIGQFINSLACVVLTQYHYNFIWAMFIAVTEFLYRKTVSLN
ncbi:MAG: O-antigen ligase family protein, partial [Candidatus Tenebribacter davisii]|nr:O-antigen ligase family protein [Candidatus Tenebribacter davisii]